MTLRQLAGVLGVLGLIGLAGPVKAADATIAQPTTTIIFNSKESPDTIAQTLKALQDKGIAVAVEFSDQAPMAHEAPAAAEPQTTGDGKKATDSGKAAKPAAKSSLVGDNTKSDETKIAGTIDHVADTVYQSFTAAMQAVPMVLSIPKLFATGWAAIPNDGQLLPNWLRIFVILIGGIIAGIATRALVLKIWKKRPITDPGNAIQRLRYQSRLGGAAFARIIVMVAVFYTLSRALFPIQDLAFVIAQSICRAITACFVYLFLGKFLLSPKNPKARLVPMPRAEYHFGILRIYSIVVPTLAALAAVFAKMNVGEQALVGYLFLAYFFVTMFRVWWFWIGRHDIAQLIRSGAEDQDHPGKIRLFLAPVASYIFIIADISIWLIELVASAYVNTEALALVASVTQVVLILTPLLAQGAKDIFSHIEPKGEAEAHAPLRTALIGTAEAAGAGLSWILGLFVLSRMWTPLLSGAVLTTDSDLFHHIGSSAAIAICGILVFRFFNLFFVAMSQARHANGDGTMTRVQSVLPIIRALVLAMVVGVTFLMTLTGLGVDAGPLLAGFGILGLAISFGSQALVKDIVSGMFFIFEDAFRVGEFIDTGKLRGTVEKISLRSLQLRQSTGSVHTVPFGQVSAVTNGSRDWATTKFNLPLAQNVNLDKARKIIKTIGQDLLNDEEFGSEFIKPMKMQGVAEITESAVQARVKFTTKPSQAGIIQREALARIYKAFSAAGVNFASGATTTVITEGPITSSATPAPAAANAAADPTTPPKVVTSTNGVAAVDVPKAAGAEIAIAPKPPATP